MSKKLITSSVITPGQAPILMDGISSTIQNAPTFWTPNSLGSNLQLWTDSTSDQTVTLSGSNVVSWHDISGNSRHLVYDAGRQPTYATGGINSQNRITYGVNSGGVYAIGTGQRWFDPSVGFTIAWVLNGTTPAMNPYLLNALATTLTVETRTQVVPSVAGYNQLATAIVSQSTIGIGLATYYDTFYKTPHYLIIQYNGAGADTPANWTITVNGTDQTVNTSANTLVTMQGADIQGSNTGTTGDGFGPAGDLYSTIFVNRPLTSLEKSSMQTYFHTVFGL